MNWFSNLFAARRELKRLASEVKYWRGRADAASADADKWRTLVLERDMLFVDRFLTAQVKTYALGDEAKLKSQTDADEAERSAALAEFLTAAKVKYEQDAIESGRSLAEAENLYRRQESRLKEEFHNDFGFSTNG